MPAITNGQGYYGSGGFLSLNVASGSSTTLLTGLTSYWSLNSQGTISSGPYAGQFSYEDSVTATNNPLYDAGDPLDPFGGFGNSIFSATGGLFGGYVQVINDQGSASAPLVTNQSFSFNNQGSYSLSFWVKNMNTWMLGIGNTASGSPASLFAVKFFSGRFQIYPQGYTNLNQVTSPIINTTQWNHVLVSVNAGILTTYINGVSEAPFGISISQTSSNASLSLCPNISGSAPNGTGNFDEIGYWNRALTPTEAASLYNGGVGIPYSYFSFTP